MKKNLTIALAAALSLGFTACDNEPFSLGSELSPSEQTAAVTEVSLTAGVYPYNTGVTVSAFMENPNEVTGSSYEYEFYAELNQAASADVTVEIKEDIQASVAETFNKANATSYTITPVEALDLVTAKVVIPKGAKRSKEPFVVRVKDASAFKGQLSSDGTYLTSVAISQSGSVASKSSANHYYIPFTKKTQYVNPNGTITGTALDLYYSQIETYPYVRNIDRLFDGYKSQDWYQNVTRGVTISITVDIGAEKEITGFKFYTNRTYTNTNPRKVTIYASLGDGTWTELGVVNFGSGGANATEQAVLFSPLTTQYLRFDVDPLSRWLGLREIEVYEK